MSTFEDYFSIQVFLIILRETLESAIIISVLLSFVHQTFYSNKDLHKESNDNNGQYNSLESTSSSEPDSTISKLQADDETLYKYLRFQIWLGGLLGLLICLMIGIVILTVFYYIGNDLWAITEHYWEGTFSILASIIISVMGIKILRVNKMQDKWKLKLSKILQKKHIRDQDQYEQVADSWSKKIELWAEKYTMFILPFVTTLREGLEAIVFIGGIGINENTSLWSIINSTILAIVLGSLIGVSLYRSGNTLSLQVFLVTSTCFLYLVAAGLFSKGVWSFELQRFIDMCGGMDVSETGHGPGSYDIKNSVWHVNCCNGEMQEDGAFWMIFTAIFGWTNSATYGSVISYIMYWIVVFVAFTSLSFEERHGYLPVIPIKWQLKRIQKKKIFLSLSEEGVLNRNIEAFQIRDSVDSTNSMTPLQD